MEKKTKKRPRKTKLIPRKDFDSDDVNITEMQNNIEETIPQMEPLSKLRKLEPKQPEEEMEFSVKVKVEEVDENMTEELKYTEDLRDLDSNIKIHSVKSLCEPTQDAPTMSDDVYFNIDEDKIREDFESLSQETTSLADKIIEIYLENTFGKRTFLIESQSPLDKHLQKILRLWRSWYKSDPEHRDAPLLYICYVCIQGWWNFSEFREHLSHCREWKCLSIQTTNYQSMLIATDGFKVVVNGPALPTFDSNCWKCNKDRSIHLKCTEDLSIHLKSEYVCDGCNTEFRTCTALSFHEGECDMYRKKIFLINGVNNENNFAMSYHCPICSYKDWDKDRLIIHISNVHTVRSDLPVDWNLVKLCTRYNRPFDEIIIKSCSSCTANFKSIPDLKTHLHNLVDDYKCKLCNKVLQKSCMEAEHMLEHTNNYMQLYKCPICPEPMYFLDEKSAKHHKSSVHPDHQERMPLWLNGYKVIIPKRLFDRLQTVKNKPAQPPAIVDDSGEVDRTNDHHAHSDAYSQHLGDTQQQRDLETPLAPETGSFDAETEIEITTGIKSVPLELWNAFVDCRYDAVVAEIELDLEEKQRDLETPHAPETGSFDAETEVEITTVNKSVPQELPDAVVADIELDLEEEQRDLEAPHAPETGSFDAETEVEITTVNKSVPQEPSDAVVAEIELDLEEEQRDLQTRLALETGSFDAETEVEITSVNKSVPQELPDAVVAEIELDLEEEQRDLETPHAPETGSFDAETEVEITSVNKSVPQELPDAVLADIELDLEEEQRDLETPHAPETGSFDAETEVEKTTVNKSVPQELPDAVLADIELDLEEEQRDLETPRAPETGSFDAETEVEITTVNKSVPQELPDAVLADIELDLEEEQRDLETPHAPETGSFDAETEVEITTVNKRVHQELPDAVVAEIELDLEEEDRDLQTPHAPETGSFDAETEVEITTVNKSVPQEPSDAVVAEIELDLEEEQRDLEAPHAPETGSFDAETEIEITTGNKSVPLELWNAFADCRYDAVVAEIELDLEEEQRDLETPHAPETDSFDAETEIEITTVNKSVPQELPDAVVAEIELDLEEEQRDLETQRAPETGSFDAETEVEITTVNKSVHQEPSDAAVAEIELDLEVSTEQCKIVTKPEMNIKFPVKKTYVKKGISKSDNLEDKTEVEADNIEVEKEIESDNIEVNENLMDAVELYVIIEVENKEDVEVTSESVNEVRAIESCEVEIKQKSENFRDYESDIVSLGDMNSGGGTGDAEADTSFEDVSNKLKRRRKTNVRYVPKVIANKYKCTKCNKAWPTLTKYLSHLIVPNYRPRTCPVCLEYCHGSVTKHLSFHVKSLFVLTYSIDHWMYPRARGNYHCKKCKESLYAKDFFRHWESHFEIGDNVCCAQRRSVDVTENPRLNEMMDTQEQPDPGTPRAPETGELIDADAADADAVAEVELDLEFSTEQSEIVTKPEMNIKFPVKKTYVKKKRISKTDNLARKTEVKAADKIIEVEKEI